PGRIHPKPEQRDQAHAEHDQRCPVHNRCLPQLHRHHRHQRKRPRNHSIERGRRHCRSSQPRNQRPARRHQHEPGQKNPDRRHRRARPARHHVPDKRPGRKHRTGRELPDRDRVNQLLFRQPVQALHELGLKKRQQDISAAEHHRPNFKKRQKQPRQPDRKSRAHSRHRHRPSNNFRKRNYFRKPHNFLKTHCAHTQQPVLRRPSRRRYQSGKHQHQHRTDSHQAQPRRQHRNHRQQRRAHARPSQLPQRLDHDRNHGRLDRRQYAFGLRQRAKAHISPRNRRHNYRRRNDEATARDNQAAPAAFQLPHEYRDFGRTRSRYQIRRRQPVQKFGMGNPPPPPHKFFFHHRQMRRRPAKRNRPQLQKHQGNLPQRRFPDFPGLSHSL